MWNLLLLPILALASWDESCPQGLCCNCRSDSYCSIPGASSGHPINASSGCPFHSCTAYFKKAWDFGTVLAEEPSCSPFDCCTQCRMFYNGRCTIWTWNAETGTCQLGCEPSAAEPSDNENSISGTKAEYYGPCQIGTNLGGWSCNIEGTTCVETAPIIAPIEGSEAPASGSEAESGGGGGGGAGGGEGEGEGETTPSPTPERPSPPSHVPAPRPPAPPKAPKPPKPSPPSNETTCEGEGCEESCEGEGCESEGGEGGEGGGGSGNCEAGSSGCEYPEGGYEEANMVASTGDVSSALITTSVTALVIAIVSMLAFISYIIYQQRKRGILRLPRDTDYEVVQENYGTAQTH